MAAMTEHGAKHRETTMTHIDLNSQDEAVKQFFLSLPVDADGALVEADGRPVARLVPIGNGTDGAPDGEGAWTKEKNARRCFLIDREIDGTLTPEEARELAILQRQLLQHLDRVAPLPLEGTRRLYEELLAKAEAARNG
jgi:hypothetical protein